MINGRDETTTRIQSAAELLFAQHGYNGVSLRQITVAAGVNVAAVNYHYSDKQSLYLEILTSRLRQLNHVRLTRLGEAETRAAGGPVPLEEIVDILARPLLQPDESSMPSFGASSRRLVGRALVEPLDFLAASLSADFQPTVTRCGQALRRHLPTLPPADFIWRYSFIVGALHHAAARLHDMESLTQGICANEDAASALRNFGVFAQKSLALGIKDF